MELIGFLLIPVLLVNGCACGDATNTQTSPVDAEDVGEWLGSDGRAGSSLASFALTPLTIWGGGTPNYQGGSGEQEFDGPAGIALSPDGKEVYVVDDGNQRIKVHGPSGDYLRSWRHERSACSWSGSSATVGEDGTLFVNDDTNHGIVGYSPLGEVRYRWSLQHTTTLCSFGHPHGLSVAADGTLLVAEPAAGQVQRYTVDGGFVGSIGERGIEESQFEHGPFHAIEFDGRVFATDAFRVLVFSNDGDFVGALRGPKDEPFAHLFLGMFSSHGWLLVLRGDEDPGFYAMRLGEVRFTQGFFVKKGHGSGALNLPMGFTIDETGNWYVADTYNHRIQVFRSSLF